MPTTFPADLRAACLALACALGACKSEPAPAAAPMPATPALAPAPPPTDRASLPAAAFDPRAIEYAETLDRTRAAPPARFAARLPKNAVEMTAFRGGSRSFPPPSYVENALCDGGAPAVLVRLDEAIAASDNRAAAMTRWREFVKDCAGPRYCAVIREVAAGPARPLRGVLASDACAPEPVAAAEQTRRTDIAQALRRAGMLADEPIVLPAEPDSSDLAFESLAAAGRAAVLDAEARGPQSHDVVLRRLARLVRPELDGATFEDIMASDGTSAESLVAYVGGERFATPVHAKDDWYDLDATVGLINSVLQARGGTMRLLMLQSEGQIVLVAAGTPDHLGNAVRAGLLKPYDGTGG